MAKVNPCLSCKFFALPKKDDCINIPEKNLGYCLNRAPFNYLWAKPYTPPPPPKHDNEVTIRDAGQQFYQTAFPVMEDTDGCGEWESE